MKKQFSFVYLLALIGATAFVSSCSDDDNKEELPALAKEVNGSYSSQKLALTYSGANMDGKTATFSTRNGKNATVTLQNILPGEPTTTLNGVPLTENDDNTAYRFETTDTKNGRTLNLSGSVEAGKLTLAVEAAFPDNALTGTWNLQTFLLDDSYNAVTSPVHMNWIAEGTTEEEEQTASFAPVLTDIAVRWGGCILPSVLKSVTFAADGNITAAYAPLPAGTNIMEDIVGNLAPLERQDNEWITSPINLCTYYVKGSKLYVVPNLDMIINVVSVSAQAKSGESNPLETLMALLQEWTTTGLPLNIRTENGVTTLYLDKATVAPLMPLIPMLKDMLPEDMAMYAAFIDMIPELFKLTTTFEAGLNLVVPAPAQ